ncbi:MAG: hypothetical protein RIB84_23885 [Sneathiellaceae bacterium]
MSAALTAALQGSLQQHMRTEALVVERSSKRGTKAATDATKTAIRRRVARALTGGKRGRNVANAIRSQVYHDGPGKDAGLVWNKFGRGKGAQFVDYLLPHVKGAMIAAPSGGFLFIPQTATRAEARRSRRVAFIPWSGGLLMIAPRPRGQFKVLAILLKRVRLKARIYLDDMPNFALRKLTAEVLNQMARER